MNSLIGELNKYKKRLLVKSGPQYISMPLDEIVFFYKDGCHVYAMDQARQCYITDKNLAELELVLDTHWFFRANRQYILNIDFIHGFVVFEKVKLKVNLTLTGTQPVIISQEMAAAFRDWIHNA